MRSLYSPRLLFVMAIVVASLSLIWIRTATVKNTYRYMQLEREVRIEEQALRRWRMRWLEATSPKRLEKLAARYSLHPPRLDQMARYPRSSSR